MEAGDRTEQEVLRQIGKWLTSTGSFHVGKDCPSKSTLIEAWPEVRGGNLALVSILGVEFQRFFNWKNDLIGGLKVTGLLAFLSCPVQGTNGRFLARVTLEVGKGPCRKQSKPSRGNLGMEKAYLVAIERV